jgi:hypothetical protein
MTRTEAKKRKIELQVELEEIRAFLDKTCPHTKKEQECISSDWDYFKSYEERCKDCNKKLREKSAHGEWVTIK